jgi:hypothetical protein
MVISIDDFIIKERGNTNFANLYLPKIEKQAKRTLRLLENKDSDLIKKFIKTHQYLPGVGSAACSMLEANVKNGNLCPFCVEFVNQINNINKEHFDWLKTLSIVNVIETNKFNDEIAKVSGQNPKLILTDGKVFELGDTFQRDISNKLNDSQVKIYNSYFIKKQRIEGKMSKTTFFAPVFDYATDDVKIYKFSPAIWNAIENSFTRAGYDFTSADFIITHNAVQGNWWSVSKKDSSPINDSITQKYQAIKDTIQKEIERQVKIPSVDEQNKNFKKYQDAVAKKLTEQNGTEDDVPEERPIQNNQPKQTKSVATSSQVINLF